MGESEAAPLWKPFPDRNGMPHPQRLAYESKADILGYGGQAGGGKALALDTPLPTPNGWTTMGAVQVGDSLFDERGQPCRVAATSEVFTDHPCYELEFDDGERIVADAGHLWLTFTAGERAALLRCSEEHTATIAARNKLRARNARTPTGTLRTTQEIADTALVREQRTNHFVPVAGAFVLPHVSLPVPPYTLGVWLGDGKTVQGKVFVDPDDAETLGHIRADGYAVRNVPSEPLGWTILGLQPVLRVIGVLGDKHIPAEYFRASVDQRLELLRGLMDTDGNCDEDGGAEFCNTNRCLAEGVLELARSLGIKATIIEGRAMLYGEDCGPKYRVKMTTDVRVFNLERKAARQNENVRQTQRHRYVVACRPVPPVPVRCIQVDSPSRLYLAGKAMVPTHNSDLLLGLAVTAHLRSIIFRREAKQGRSLIDRSHELLHDHGRFNGTLGVWRDLPGGRQIEFAGVKNPNDVLNWRGQPHDYIGIDEADSFLESQVRFLLGWNRTTVIGQRCRAVLCFNPPASAEGRWLLTFFGPWVDKKHPRPALPGELRWYAMVGGKEVERPDGQPFQVGNETITPRSRTFIPASVLDNPILMATGYVSALQALPEPLRSQLLYGDFSAGLEDDPWQVIPTAWVEAAMARWKPDGRGGARLDALGVDVARGGAAKTVLCKRHGAWFAPLEKHPGSSTPDGPAVVRLVSAALRENPSALVNVDAIGIGSSPVDWLKGLNIGRLQAVNFGAHAGGKDRSGMLSFCNVRAKAYWMVRELLDPAGGEKLAIPPDPELLADLTAVRWSMTVRGVKLEEKAEVSKRIGRSPDCADSFVLSCLLTKG